MNTDLLINSFQVIAQNWEIILALLAFIFWGTLLIFAWLKKITGFQFTDHELTALALGGWPLPALLVSLLTLFLRTFLPAWLVMLIAAVIILFSGWAALRTLWKQTSYKAALPVLIFLALAFIRLGYAAGAIMPAYFDSAEHYRIIQELLALNSRAALAWPTTAYYHLGYHVILAAITAVTSANIGQIMLLFGQFTLAALPLPIYFLIYRVTFSKSAALLGLTFAAFGWFMPAHAVNWGKYPALLSLVLLQFTLGVLIIKNRRLFALAAIAAVVIHTRSAILFGMFGAAWILSILWEKQNNRRRIVSFGVIAILIGTLILLIYQNQVLSPILEPYMIWGTLLAALLAVTVFQAFSQLIVFSVFATLFMLIGLFIPVTQSLTLLDRPLVQMLLFLPLAFIGGLSGVRLPKFATLILSAVIIFYAWTNFSFSPSKCCQLISRDDATALTWMDKHIPDDARVAIAAVSLNLNAYGKPIRGAGIDAGIWVTPLTQNTAIPLPNTTDFTKQAGYDLLCQYDISYIYVGARPQSFMPDFVNIQPTWYEATFSLPKAHIIKVLNCVK